jgi:phosphoribosylformylglycinamidine synthase
VRVGVVRFPGSCDERDAVDACERAGHAAEILWHRERDLGGVDMVVVPGGFSFGDYLRVGAIARFSPVMEGVMAFAREGGPVLGICNGFQVLCEAGLLPGALLPNVGLRFVCRQVGVEVRSTDTPFTATCRVGDVLSIPVKHTSGRYYAPPRPSPSSWTATRSSCATPTTATRTGSSNDIAGRLQRGRNVVGPHAASRARGGPADGLRGRAAPLRARGGGAAPCPRVRTRSRSA